MRRRRRLSTWWRARAGGIKLTISAAGVVALVAVAGLILKTIGNDTPPAERSASVSNLAFKPDVTLGHIDIPGVEVPPDDRNIPGTLVDFAWKVVGWKEAGLSVRWTLQDANTQAVITLEDPTGYLVEPLPNTGRAGSESGISSVWVRLPTTAGTYQVKIELLVDGHPRGRGQSGTLMCVSGVDCRPTPTPTPSSSNSVSGSTT
jgi:hypothetical protein